MLRLVLKEVTEYNIHMSNDKKKHLIASIARSMEAEGFNFQAVKKTLEKKLQPNKA